MSWYIFKEHKMSIYDFSVLDIHGNQVNLSDFKNKTLLVVNTATKCSLTPQYEGLEELYQKYQDKDFVILDFPSNEFLELEGDNEEIISFLEENYQISFPIFAKIDINGEHTHPLYAYLKNKQSDEIINSKYEILLEIIKEMGMTRTGNDIKWNFTKFLINQHGEVVARFAPTISPKEMEETIVKTLENQAVA